MSFLEKDGSNKYLPLTSRIINLNPHFQFSAQLTPGGDDLSEWRHARTIRPSSIHRWISQSSIFNINCQCKKELKLFKTTVTRFNVSGTWVLIGTGLLGRRTGGSDRPSAGLKAQYTRANSHQKVVRKQYMMIFSDDLIQMFPKYKIALVLFSFPSIRHHTNLLIKVNTCLDSSL